MSNLQLLMPYLSFYVAIITGTATSVIYHMFMLKYLLIARRQ